MAGIEVRGFADLRRNTERIRRVVLEDAMEAAYATAAETIRSAAEAASPVRKTRGKRPVGQLRRSNRIFKGKTRELAATGSQRSIGRMLVGPSKEKGYYGYWLEEGWHPAGRRITYYAKAGRWWSEGKWVATRRRLRQARGTTHSQMGSIQNENFIEGTRWFSRIAAGAEESAQEAGRNAFDEVMRREIR